MIAGSPFPLPSIPEARDAGVKHFGNVRSIKGLLIAILTFPFRLGMPFISMLPRAWKVLGRRPKAFSDGDCNHASVPANAQKLKGQGARQDKFWSDPGPQVGHTLSIVGTLGGRSFITWAQRMLTSTGESQVAVCMDACHEQGDLAVLLAVDASTLHQKGC